mmetsp:Transcript_30736/g.91603  ORF Transcript_30736/g.91603 Transcript_30736/m.91603 type:complete len:204 (+) Transcript_30736:184-795(+)
MASRCPTLRTPTCGERSRRSCESRLARRDGVLKWRASARSSRPSSASALPSMWLTRKSSEYSPRPMECSQLQTSPLLQESSRAAAEPPRAPPASAEEPSGPGRPSGTGEADPDDRKREIKEPTALAPAPAEAFGGGNGAAREMLADGATLVPASDRSEKPPCMLGVRLLRGEEHCWSAGGGGASGGGGGESQRLERLDSGAPR